VFHLAPFNLPWASQVFAKIVANNIYGSSDQSSPGSGTIIYAVPDVPTTLTDNTAARTSTTLGLTWVDGDDSGGLPVIDYRVYVTSTTGSYRVIVNVTTKGYNATGLSLGVSYNFIVQSRNSYGYSSNSSTLLLLCAILPNVPTNVLTVNSASNVIVSWIAPSSNGSPITAYMILILTGSMTFA
jgi:hypothetical protein